MTSTLINQSYYNIVPHATASKRCLHTQNAIYLCRSRVHTQKSYRRGGRVTLTSERYFMWPSKATRSSPSAAANNSSCVALSAPSAAAGVSSQLAYIGNRIESNRGLGARGS